VQDLKIASAATADDSLASAELDRLRENAGRQRNWQRWGPYLSERQWATVREDYSADGDCWTGFPFDQAASRAYRWGEDGLLGIADRECRLCFALALWNGRDPILKERLFGLTNHEGNHSEDVKECYYYLDATPTYSYCRALYKYPQGEFPYQRLRDENRRRGRLLPEYELTDTGIFAQNNYFDVFIEYAKASPDDLLIRITIANRAATCQRLFVLPTLWFRNTWSWQARYDEGRWPKPSLRQESPQTVSADHVTLGRFVWTFAKGPGGKVPPLLFTENETNVSRLYGAPRRGGYFKDAFHDYLVRGRTDAVKHDQGTKAAALYALAIPPGETVTLCQRLTAQPQPSVDAFGPGFDAIFNQRIGEADAFYRRAIPHQLSPDEQSIARQAYAGLLWSKQFYHYVVPDWITGDRWLPLTPQVQQRRINQDWKHLFSRDVLSVPDKWEYPAFFAWDLAFHMIPMARIDPDFAKRQLLLLLREWYLHPNGQLPAFEYNFSDVNPPVHAWACWQVFKLTGGTVYAFLERAFHKLLLNFTWWVNREDPDGRNVFAGGFLGMDNIGVFDRSKPLPTGGTLEQADGTAWMGFYCTTMLAIALDLALWNKAYEDVASKFFEHFVQIADALNNLGGTGLWHEEDGFYYDQLLVEGRAVPLRLRSLVGFVPLLAVHVLEEQAIGGSLKDFEKRMFWFLDHRGDLWRYIANLEERGAPPQRRRLLSLPSRDRLERVLRYLLDESEFLSPYGVRSLSRAYKDQPFVFHAADGRQFEVRYTPGDMETWDFGGNSNWRGPIWFPINFLLVEALERYHRYYGDSFQVECPTGSGRLMNLQQVSRELATRLSRLFVAEDGRRACHADQGQYADDPHWRDYVLFYEYFDGDTGRGLGASHQTGWTALIASLLERCAAQRSPGAKSSGKVTDVID
jgi:hypothetical protein